MQDTAAARSPDSEHDVGHDIGHDIERACAVYDLGGLTARARPAARGQQGVVWRVETTTGVYAVKHLLDPLTEDDVALDTALITRMLHRGLRAPEPLRTVSGSVLARIGDTLVRVARWVDLDEPTPTLAPGAVGTVLATLHRDPIPAPGPVDPWYTDPVPHQEWGEVAAALTAAGAPFAEPFAAAVPHWLAMQRLLRPPVGQQLCHRDLWADNLRRTGEQLCVIDWDNCGPAEPAQELAMVLFEFCYADVERARTLYTAYRDAGGPGRLTGPGDFTMTAAQLGHFAVTAGRRWLQAAPAGAGDETDDAAHDERDRAQQWFYESLDRPLDLEQVDLLLTCVT